MIEEIDDEQYGVKVFRGLIWATGIAFLFWGTVAATIFIATR